MESASVLAQARWDPLFDTFRREGRQQYWYPKNSDSSKLGLGRLGGAGIVGEWQSQSETWCGCLVNNWKPSFL